MAGHPGLPWQIRVGQFLGFVVWFLRQEHLAVTKVYNAYKGRNFDILDVSLDDEASRAKLGQVIK